MFQLGQNRLCFGWAEDFRLPNRSRHLWAPPHIPSRVTRR